jgi:hypothetical protein
MCGDSVWKAAAVKGKAYANKDVTGCMLATCRHCYLLKALDMKRGEIYAYPYALQVSIVSTLYCRHELVFTCDSR